MYKTVNVIAPQYMRYFQLRADTLTNNSLRSVSNGPRQANLCLRAFRHDKF